MTTATFANLSPTPSPTSDNVDGLHTTVVSIAAILLVTIILIELAGTSRTAAVGVGFLFLAVIALAGMTHSGNLSNLAKYPAQP